MKTIMIMLMFWLGNPSTLDKQPKIYKNTPIEIRCKNEIFIDTLDIEVRRSNQLLNIQTGEWGRMVINLNFLNRESERGITSPKEKSKTYTTTVEIFAWSDGRRIPIRDSIELSIGNVDFTFTKNNDTWETDVSFQDTEHKTLAAEVAPWMKKGTVIVPELTFEKKKKR